MTELTQVLATENEQEIIWEPPERQKDSTRKETGYKDTHLHKFDDFMLKKPEPVRKDLEFTAHKLGVKGTLRRTEIYEDR